MTVAVIDGLGGGLGAQIIASIRQTFADRATILALGTNAVATDRMIKSGAARGASGANAIRVSLAQADFIVAPLGVVVPDSMMGEITTEIAAAVAGCRAVKILLPMTQTHFTIVGLEAHPVGSLVAEAVAELERRSGDRSPEGESQTIGG